MVQEYSPTFEVMKILFYRRVIFINNFAMRRIDHEASKRKLVIAILGPRRRPLRYS